MSLGILAWYAVSGLVAAAVLAALGTLGLRAPRPGAPGPGPFRGLLAAGAVTWAAHYAEVWRPVNWENAAPRLTAWPGGAAFALVAPVLAAAVYGLAWRAAPRRPLLAAVAPPVWHIGYRWFLVQLLYWGAPGEYFAFHDDPAGLWLFLRTSVLAGALLLYAAVLRARRPRLAPGVA
jgi:hypothetical protein